VDILATPSHDFEKTAPVRATDRCIAAAHDEANDVTIASAAWALR
jgi:hypothetical protein